MKVVLRRRIATDASRQQKFVVWAVIKNGVFREYVKTFDIIPLHIFTPPQNNP